MSLSPEAEDAVTPAPSKSRLLRPARRLLIIVLTTVAAGYVGVCAGIYWWQGSLIYYPSRVHSCTPADYELPFEDLTLTAADGVPIAAWYVPSDANVATVLFCSGNAGNMAASIRLLQALHQLGYNVAVFDYEGFGASGGTPSEAGTYAAAEAVWAYLTQTRHEPAGRIILIGRSLGGGVAIELAQRHTPAALVVESTFTSMVDVGQREYPYLPVGLLCSYRYESIKKVGQITCPKLFVHGSDDRLVPLEMARRLFAAAAEPKTFIETPGGHNSGGLTRTPLDAQRLNAWLKDVLSGRAGR